MTSLTPPRPDFIDASPGDELPRNVSPFLEIGRSGLKRVSGYVDDEFLPQLRGRKAVKIYREMSDNSSVIGGWAAAVTQLLRQLEWRVEAASNRREDRVNREFVEQQQEDMEVSWGEMISEVSSFIIYGWELSEIVYKRRIGPWETDPAKHSKYTDGRIGWRKIAGRAQDTMWRWVFADNGDILGMVQMAPPRYEKVVIPLNRCLLFRTTTAKGSPEGRALIRNAYSSWFFLKRFQEIEATGVARDLAGMPIAKVPSKLLAATPGSKDAAMLQAVRNLVQSVSRNENEGIVWPWDLDEETKQPLMDFALLTSGGSRQFDTESIINRYKTEMLQAVLADFLMVGHEDNGGSYALHTDKTGLFRNSINALAQAIADQFNRHAIPRLFAVNGMKPAELPRLVPNDVDPPALAELAQFMTALAGTGLQWFPDPELEKFLRDAARLPQLDPDIENVREIEQRNAAVLSLAQQKLQMLQTEQQAQTGAVQLAQQKMGVAQQAAGMLDQSDAIENPPPPDPTVAAQAQQQAVQGQVATQTAQTKLAQEKTKLAQLRQGTPRKKPAKKPSKGARR